MSFREKIPADDVMAVSESQSHDCYPGKAEALKACQSGLDSLIKSGAMPEGTKLLNVRVDEISMLVECPDGRKFEVAARCVPADAVNDHIAPPRGQAN
jgi:hypothetical protein